MLIYWQGATILGRILPKKELGVSTDPEFLHSGFESGSLNAENVCRAFFSAAMAIGIGGSLLALEYNGGQFACFII